MEANQGVGKNTFGKVKRGNRSCKFTISFGDIIKFLP